MEKKEQKRDYNMADASLIVMAGEKHHFILRDIVEFNNYNVQASDMVVFKNDISAFESLPTDEELEGIQIEATNVKNTVADNLKVAVREVMQRVKLKYGEEHGKYRQFGTLGMNDFDDAHLLICGRRVVRTATAYSADLSTKGLTVAMITNVSNLANSFENALLDKSDAIAKRDIATDDRIEAGNILYKKVVDYCETGKTIWVTRDESKHNDYVIYDAPSASAPAATTPV
jgi:hypothetical protein